MRGVLLKRDETAEKLNRAGFVLDAMRGAPKQTQAEVPDLVPTGGKWLRRYVAVIFAGLLLGAIVLYLHLQN